MNNSRYVIQLRDNLDQYFNGEELSTLCFDLGLNYNDDLPGKTKKIKATELIEHMLRHKRLSELVNRCQKLRPKVVWSYHAKIFIAHNSKSGHENDLAQYLHAALASKGHRVIVDQDMSGGEHWIKNSDTEIKDADFFIVLLSELSVNSEMVRVELQRAFKYHQQQGYPQTIPVRMDYEGHFPYAIAALVNSHQNIVWQGNMSNENVSQGVLAIIENEIPDQVVPALAASKFYSEDGLSLQQNQIAFPPSPEFDPRLIKQLRAPGGAVRIRDKFYVERDSDQRLRDEIVQWGTTISIRAPGQTGKTSLLVRGLRYAKKRGAEPIFLDLQSLGKAQLASANKFARWLVLAIAQELELDVNNIEQAWEDDYGQDQLTFIIEDHILPHFDVPIILALDEADVLLSTDFHRDFFGLVRSWHNRRAMYDEWELFNVVLVISTEPYLLIDDLNQSPFNVGLCLDLKDFNTKQVHDLNIAHGSPLSDQELAEVMKLIHGQPYLTRKLFYVLITEQMSWRDFSRTATENSGPFFDHLSRLHWKLREHEASHKGLKQIIDTGKCDNDQVLHRLLRAGLVRGIGGVYTCRCQLYEQYFENKLL